MATSYIPITFFDGEKSSFFSTYDENLQTKENSQYSFSFSVTKYCNDKLNPIFFLLVENRRLRLQTATQKIDFVITGITPKVTNKNVEHQITCQDAFSYDLSKQNISITYEPEVPKNIKELSTEILELGKMTSRWRVDPELEADYYASFPAWQQLGGGLVKSRVKMKATISASNSTIYNALVDVATKFNANMRVEYSDIDGEPGIIYFDNKITQDHSGFSFRPSSNISELSLNRKTDNFCSVMHVSGSEDAEGNIVSIAPPIPLDVQLYFKMLYPTKNADFGNTSYNYLVVGPNNEEGNYSLYQKKDGNWNILDDDYTPWTVQSSAEIKDSYNNFTSSEDNASLFTLSTKEEVENYFNFLIYRAKSGGSIFYDFQYYLDAGLLDSETYNKIEEVFSKTLRNANILHSCTVYQYNSLSASLQDFKNREEEYFAQLAAREEERYLYDIGELETPESVLTTDFSGALSKDTILNTIENERVSLLNLLKTNIWVNDYYRLLFTIDGANAIEDRCAKLEELVAKKKEEFDENFGNAQKLLDTAPGDTLEEKEESLYNGDPAIYTDYAVYKKRYTNALTYIDETPLMTNPSADITAKRMGLYTIQLYYLNQMLESNENNDPYGYAAAHELYKKSPNLKKEMEDSAKRLSDIWTHIYSNYGNFIAETSFNDSDQLSSEGLFMAAMKAFNTYSKPTQSYNITSINSSFIEGIDVRDPQVCDIINVYQKELSAQYGGLCITVASNFFDSQGDAVPPSFGSTCKLISSVGEIPSGINGDLSIKSIKHRGDKIDIILDTEVEKSVQIMNSKEIFTKLQFGGVIKTDTLTSVDVFAKILDIQLIEKEVPIVLTITGTSKKLREATTQLTVTTDRTVDLVYNRLLRQAKF